MCVCLDSRVTKKMGESAQSMGKEMMSKLSVIALSADDG